MLMLMGRSDPATSEAVHFAQSMLDGSATAFYEVDEGYNLRRFLLSGIPEPFHRQYLDGMSAFDPQHPRHAGGLVVARLSKTIAGRQAGETALYRSFLDQCGIVDMMDFFFRRDDQIVAGMSVAWDREARIPEGAVTIAHKIHQYLQFNLVGRASAPEDGQQRIRESFDISVLPEDAMEEIRERITTKIRFNAVVQTGVPGFIPQAR